MSWQPILPFDYNKELQMLIDTGYKKEYAPELLDKLIENYNKNNENKISI